MLPSGGINTYPTNPYVNDPVDFTNSKSTPATPDNKGLSPLSRSLVAKWLACSGGSRIFPGEGAGANSQSGCANLFFRQKTA